MHNGSYPYFSRFRVIDGYPDGGSDTVRTFNSLGHAKDYAAKRYASQEPKLCSFRVLDSRDGGWQDYNDLK